MSVTASDPRSLEGQQVAFTGRLASLTRAAAADLVRAHGGEWAPTVTPRTSVLVVGQEGWPLRQDGRLTRKLQKARWLQRTSPITILAEADFLDRLGRAAPAGVQRLSTAELSKVLQVPGERVRGWVQRGLLEPAETVLGMHYFDLRQASWAKTLCAFARAGVTPDRVRRSLEQLKHWLPGVEQPLAQLGLLERDGKLLVRLDEGGLAEETGQRLFDFDESGDAQTVAVAPNPETAEQWFERGRALEEAGHREEAAAAYRRSLLLGGPDAEASFNLGNVLYTLGRKEQAAERYWQAVEVDRSFVEAWNNLGNVLAELGQSAEALSAYQAALRLDPGYGDAHYNVADLLDELGRAAEALPHWRSFVGQDRDSPWAEHARERLAQTSQKA